MDETYITNFLAQNFLFFFFFWFLNYVFELTLCPVLTPNSIHLLIQIFQIISIFAIKSSPTTFYY